MKRISNMIMSIASKTYILNALLNKYLRTSNISKYDIILRVHNLS